MIKNDVFQRLNRLDLSRINTNTAPHTMYTVKTAAKAPPSTTVGINRPIGSVTRPTSLHIAGRSYFSFSSRLSVFTPAMKSLPGPS